MRSKFLRLSARDFFKGLLVSVVTAVLTALLTLLQAGVEFKWKSFIPVLYAGIAALVAYLLKNLFTNNQGELFTSDK
jgi:branched-subunit amino acid transport protein